MICPLGYGCIMAWNETCLGGMVFLREESCLGILVQGGQIHHHCKLHIGVVVVKMACLSTNKASVIIRHHVDNGGC